MVELKGKKVFVIGERDGVPAPAIAACVQAAGGEIVFMDTQCFVWTAAGAMDQEVQGKIKQAAEEHGAQNVVVLLGSPDPDSADIYAETVTLGDPTFAGPLAGVSLRLPVYHILEDEIKSQIPEDVYQEHIGISELSLDKDAICEMMKKARERAQE